MKQRILSKLRLWAWVLPALVFAVPAVSLPARAEESPVPAIQKMIRYYRYYQEDAGEEIQELLEQIAAIDPEQGDLWEAVMANWSYCNDELEVPYDVLPDGLAQDDSLCIVVLGYALNGDGTMRPELIQRLQVALASAQKYPNAYVAVTGGGTAAYSDITEAEAMANWLEDNGVARERLILETESLSTTYNAVNTYAMLVRDYPSVKGIAVISSDYHVPWGYVLFQTVCEYTRVYGETVIPVVGCAANKTETTMDTMGYQVSGICTITGIPTPTGGKPSG